jgi:thiol:disulfide interchange protein
LHRELALPCWILVAQRIARLPNTRCRSLWFAVVVVVAVAVAVVVAVAVAVSG